MWEILKVNTVLVCEDLQGYELENEKKQERC